MQFILRHERAHTLQFAALDSDVGRRVRARYPAIGGIDSMVWVEAPGTSGEQVLIRSDAVLRVARYIGGIWRAAGLGQLIPGPLRDALYDFIARHRHQLTAERERCYIPPTSVRPRFLD